MIVSVIVSLTVVDSAVLPALDTTTDPFPSLTADQPYIDFDTQSQLMSTSTTSPVDLLLSASADHGQLCFQRVGSITRHMPETDTISQLKKFDTDFLCQK